MQRPEAVVAVSIRLWEKLAQELISIIGEGGFHSLYTRSLHLTGATFPWILNGQPPQSDARFSALKTSLDERDSAEAGQASVTLLITFIDILALLIGELLTTSILRMAWGNDAMDTVAKEFPQ